MSRSRGDLSMKEFDNLTKFSQIQNVRGDGNCGVYAAVEELLNLKEICDYIDVHCNEVLMNFTCQRKKLNNGTVRGKKRDDWIKNDVMKRMWKEGGKYLPKAKEEDWLSSNWHVPVLAVM